MNTNTKEMIKKYNIRMTKSLGQNFLVDGNMVKRIVDAADIKNDELVVEVGPGIGSMTIELVQRAGHVLAIEIDKYLIPALTDHLKDYNNITILNKDILKTDIKDLASGSALGQNLSFKANAVKVVANLPYYITTPIIMKFLEENPGIDTLVFMVQKEVARRMVAKPGGKDYGALSVAVQYYSKPEIVFDVPPHCFTPQPDVDSSVIRLDVYKEPSVKLDNEKIFFNTVKASFGQRRKTLVNALSNCGYFKETKEEIKEILRNLGIGENQRGETLTISQFAQVANAFSVKNS